MNMEQRTKIKMIINKYGWELDCSPLQRSVDERSTQLKSSHVIVLPCYGALEIVGVIIIIIIIIISQVIYRKFQGWG